MFALGGYGPDADVLFNRQKEFVNHFLDSYQYQIENGYVNIGLLTYDRNAFIVKKFNEHFVTPYIRKYVNNLKPSKNGAAIGRGMDAAAESIFPNGRKNTLKFLVLFTDVSGFADKTLVALARTKLQNQGVDTIMIGAGNKVNKADLVGMVNKPNNIITGLTSKTFLTAYTDVIEKFFEGMF